MPAKPVEHGIKVYALCCALSAVVIAFFVYVGKEDNLDGSAVAVCNELVVEAGLTGARGRVLYTDNYYASIKLVKHMFNNYRLTIVGTVTTTDKMCRQDEDIPFLKLSNGTRLGVKRGWFREAVIKLKSTAGKHYCISAQPGGIRSKCAFCTIAKWGSVMDCL